MFVVVGPPGPQKPLTIESTTQPEIGYFTRRASFMPEGEGVVYALIGANVLVRFWWLFSFMCGGTRSDYVRTSHHDHHHHHPQFQTRSSAPGPGRATPASGPGS